LVPVARLEAPTPARPNIEAPMAVATAIRFNINGLLARLAERFG
jgi:hypothetical protein